MHRCNINVGGIGAGSQKAAPMVLEIGDPLSLRIYPKV